MVSILKLINRTLLALWTVRWLGGDGGSLQLRSRIYFVSFPHSTIPPPFSPLPTSSTRPPFRAHLPRCIPWRKSLLLPVPYTHIQRRASLPESTPINAPHLVDCLASTASLRRGSSADRVDFPTNANYTSFLRRQNTYHWFQCKTTLKKYSLLLLGRYYIRQVSPDRENSGM